MYQIKYNINHGNWVEPISLSWSNDTEWIREMLGYLIKSNVTDIRVVKQIDVTDEFISVF